MRQYFSILFLILALIPQLICAQDQDFSLINEIKNNSTTPQEAIIKAKLYLTKAKDDKKSQGYLLKHIGSSFQLLSELDSAMYYYQKSKKIATEINDKQLLSANLYNISIIYQNQGSYHLALPVSLDALKLDRELQNIDNQILSLNSIAASYENLNIFDKALEYQLEAVQLCESNKKDAQLAAAHFNLANIYAKNGKTDKALTYYNKAKLKYNELLSKDSSDFLLNQGKSEIEYAVGSLFMQLNNMDSARKYFTGALNLKNKIDDKSGISKCLLQQSNIEYQLKNYPQALDLNFASLQQKLKINDNEGKALVYTNIGKIKFSEGKVDEALTFFQKSIEIASSISSFTILKEDYHMMSQLYSNKNDFKKALIYKTLYTQTLDTLYKIQGQCAVQEMSIKYETEKTEQQNILLQQENVLKEEIIKKQKTMTYLISGIALLVLIIVVIVYLQYRTKKRANIEMQEKNELLNIQKNQIEEQKNLIEHKNKDLTDSIHYAKRIQESMLVNPQEIMNKLKDCFILFKPKDIVSGDFYWIGEKDNKIIFSAIDCTGHGVPGAFMSMLGDSYLNQIVYNYDITAPDEILNELNKHIRNALNQESTQNQDGMDMVLCTIDLATMTVECACAKNPLLYIQNGEIFKIKGDNQPIGGGAYDLQPFTKHQIKVDSTTSFYMFSDGYQDQFGGENNKKFMIKKMQELLLQHYTKPMHEQKLIMDKTIVEWMGNNEQVDDIVVVGFTIG